MTDRRTGGRTDGRTNGRTDTLFYRTLLAESEGPIKKPKKVKFYACLNAYQWYEQIITTQSIKSIHVISIHEFVRQNYKPFTKQIKPKQVAESEKKKQRKKRGKIYKKKNHCKCKTQKKVNQQIRKFNTDIKQAAIIKSN